MSTHYLSPKRLEIVTVTGPDALPLPFLPLPTFQDTRLTCSTIRQAWRLQDTEIGRPQQRLGVCLTCMHVQQCSAICAPCMGSPQEATTCHVACATTQELAPPPAHRTGRTSIQPWLVGSGRESHGSCLSKEPHKHIARLKLPEYWALG